MNLKEWELEKQNETPDKRIWISPEISNWENENIENSGGLGPDGSGQAYII